MTAAGLQVPRSPRFDAALRELGFGEESARRSWSGSSPRHLPAFPELHTPCGMSSSFRPTSLGGARTLRAALQAFVDNSLSKTVNFSEQATEENVARAYVLAWELGCKGVTVYVTGTRARRWCWKQRPPSIRSRTSPPDPTLHHTYPSHPGRIEEAATRDLMGETYAVETPVGKAFITIMKRRLSTLRGFHQYGQGRFRNRAVSEALGRLISYVLRMASPVLPAERLREVMRQLLGIGGGRSRDSGPNRVRSLPDGIGQVLDQYLRRKDGLVNDAVAARPPFRFRWNTLRLPIDRGSRPHR